MSARTRREGPVERLAHDAAAQPDWLKVAESIAAGVAFGLLLTRPQWGRRMLAILQLRGRVGFG
jgi:hypothetical protein